VVVFMDQQWQHLDERLHMSGCACGVFFHDHPPLATRARLHRETGLDSFGPLSPLQYFLWRRAISVPTGRALVVG
jgi:hypothetical protein